MVRTAVTKSPKSPALGAALKSVGKSEKAIVDEAPSQDRQNGIADPEGLLSIFATDDIPELQLDSKRKFVDPTPQEYEILQHELMMRLAEARETIIEIGHGENGQASGLGVEELDKSVATLARLAAEFHAKITLLREKDCEEGKVADYLVREEEREHQFQEVRVAVIGNVDAGKSTLLGVLTHGELDNGRGHARQKLFTHKHEKDSGRTSSVGQEILGFGAGGDVINHNIYKRAGQKHGPHFHWDLICAQASKVIAFIDLAGHEKYLKTTIYGMTSHAPDYGMLMIGGNMGIVGMTKEHLGLTLALNVPVFIVVTKIDMAPPNVLADTLKLLVKILKSPACRKTPLLVQNSDDVITAATNFTSERLCPIFQVSNVTGQNLNLLHQFLNLLQPPIRNRYDPKAPTEFTVGEIYTVAGVGTVVFGMVHAGTIKVNDTLLIGPDWSGKFEEVAIKSIHRRRLPVEAVEAGQSVCLGLKKLKRNQVRKGMVVCAKELKPQGCRLYEVDILILHHPTTIGPSYQAMVHCGSVRQTVIPQSRIVKMDRECLRTGDRATITLQFMQYPEYVKPGTQLVFRDGRTKAVGKIKRVLPFDTPLDPSVHIGRRRRSKTDEDGGTP